VNQSLSVSFGQCVRALRQEQGWTQVTFSERCGFYQTYLSRIENGQANPTLNAMEVIATGLGLSIFQLFDRVRLSMEAAVASPAAASVEAPSIPESA
jgi:transcriptional regulator with XRE-family HTH domain